MLSTDAVAQDVGERRTERLKQIERNGSGIVAAKQRSIAVLTPTMGQVSMWWHTSLVDLLWPMNVGKAFIPILDRVGGEVGQMRNRLVKMALDFSEQQGIDLHSIMWIDDDVIVSRLAMLTLAAHDRDIASGVYFSKGEVGEPLIFAGPSSGTEPFKPNKVFESWGYAQGLSLVKTEVFRRMRDDLDIGEDKYGNPCWFKQPEFGVTKNGQLTIGGTEDFWFFENAAKLGYRPLVDCTKHSFGWHYDAKVGTGYPTKQWEMHVKREPIAWDTKEGVVVWE